VNSLPATYHKGKQGGDERGMKGWVFSVFFSFFLDLFLNEINVFTFEILALRSLKLDHMLIGFVKKKYTHQSATTVSVLIDLIAIYVLTDLLAISILTNLFVFLYTYKSTTIVLLFL
jgi:hypothetical protein